MLLYHSQAACGNGSDDGDTMGNLDLSRFIEHKLHD